MFITKTNPNAFERILKAMIAGTIFVGIIWLSSGRDEAKPLPDDSLSNFEQEGAYFYELGKTYDYAGERELAYENLTKAVDLLPPEDPRLLNTYVLLSRLLLPLGQPLDKSKNHEINKYISILINPQNTNTEQAWGYSLLSELRRMENNKIDAISYGKKAITLDPESAAAQHVYGMSLFGGRENGKQVFYTDNLDEVINAFTKSVEIQKTMSPSWYLLGVAYWYKGDKEKARGYWQESLRLLPNDPYYPAWFKVALKQKVDIALTNPYELDGVRR